jgi:adenine-specific DNA methylase
LSRDNQGWWELIETSFDISFAASLALKEKQIQQNYRPIIAVHKWFARRPGSLFRCLLLSEFASRPLAESYYQPHSLEGLRVADCFMGGGTPLLEANRMGCDVVGFDINPMAYWIVQEEIESIDLKQYRQRAKALRRSLVEKLGRFYATNCTKCGNEATAKYFLWVKTIACEACNQQVDLYPGYVVSTDARHPKNVLVCAKCGQLNESDDREKPGACTQCAQQLNADGPAKRGQCACNSCGHINKFPIPENGPPKHRLFALEYYCSACKPGHKGRFFKRPDESDHARCHELKQTFTQMRTRFVPDEEIIAGDETNRLHRWGYRRYSELFNARQLVGLELSCRLIEKENDERIRHALATNLSDLLRYQNMLCRYDTKSLKSLDIFSIHGFPVSLVQVESNILGISNGNGVSVGSGGWPNITEKYARAKRYCEKPFEVKHNGTSKKTLVPVCGEWIGERRVTQFMGKETVETRHVDLNCGSSTAATFRKHSIDAVFTDPPYFGNVQYAELMDFCYVWLRRLIQNGSFNNHSTRNPDELTGNATLSRGLEHFAEGLSRVFANMAEALKPDSPLAFTFHHNRIEAYYPVVGAILDSGLICTGSIPCPAEMAASIHIHGTNSAIIDSIMVARAKDATPLGMLVDSQDEFVELVASDLRQLELGGVKPTRGDIRCVTFGHMARLAAHSLHEDWDASLSVSEKLTIIGEWIEAFCETDEVIEQLAERLMDELPV